MFQNVSMGMSTWDMKQNVFVGTLVCELCVLELSQALLVVLVRYEQCYLGSSRQFRQQQYVLHYYCRYVRLSLSVVLHTTPSPQDFASRAQCEERENVLHLSVVSCLDATNKGMST